MPYIANPLEGLPIRNSFITDQANLGAAAASDDTIIIYDISATALKQLTIANMQAGILVSPAFTGTPTAPTQSAGNDTTRVATTAFVTAATTALNTVSEMTDVTISSVGSGEVLKWNGSAWINQTLSEANILPVSGPTFTGVLTVGSAVISEADLEQIDDLTAGTAVASKALVVDSNKDIGTIRNLTIDGVFTDGNYTFATDGSVTGLGAITSTGVVTATGFTIGSAVIAEAELEMIDGITAGTAAASKALVLDSNKDIGTIRNLTIDGVFTDGNYTFATDGTVTGLGTVASGTHTIGSLVVAAASITDTSGAITFGNENLSTTGTLAAGTTTIGTLTVAAASITDSSGTISFGNENLTTSGVVTAGGITLGSAVLIEAELEMLDGITAGTAAASKALVLDSSKDIGTIRNLTIDGVFTDGNYSFDTSGNVTGLGTIGSGNITSTGTVQGTTITATTAFVPDASDGAALGTTALEFSDLFLADAAAINFGDDQDVTLTHVVDTGLLLNSTMALQFNDASQYINAPSTTVLDINATDEIELNATLVDINANVEISGTATTTGVHTFTAVPVFPNDTVETDDIQDNAVTLAKMAGIARGKIIYGDSSGNPAILTVGSSGQSLTSDGTDISWGAGGAISTYSNYTNNRVITSVDSSSVNSEANLTFDGSTLAVTGDATVSDDLSLVSDAAVLSFGANSEVTLTHVHDDGLLLNADMQLQFRDSAINIRSDADGDLDINADDEIELNSTLIDVNGNLDVSGTIVSAGVITGTAFTAGSAVLAEAELELLDELTPGTAIASKVVTTDSSIDTTGQRNLTISGELDAATGDFSGAVDVAGAFSLAGTAVTSSAAELNLLDALDRGSILYGNASGVTTVLGQGGANQLLTSDGTDIAWQDAAASGISTTQAANTVLVRDADSSGAVSAKAVTNTQILIGDGTGFTAATPGGDVSAFTNAGAVTIASSHSGSAHHADAHTVASHSDTSGTGAELETLTDGSTTSLHAHSAPAHNLDSHSTRTHSNLQSVGANDHHASSHSHGSHSSVGANDHHASSHSHGSHSGVGANDHHAESHSHTGGTAVAGRSHRTYTTSTTSTGYTDFTSASVTFTTGAYPVAYGAFQYAVNTSSTHNQYVNVLVDGTQQNQQVVSKISYSVGSQPNSFAGQTAVLSAASHTIKMQWKTSYGTTTMSGSIFWAHEVR